jgi:hypothetical protein
MTNLVCAKPLQGDVLRVTRLDECGAPEYGECAFGISDGYVQAVLTPSSEEGERFLQRNAAGRAIVNQRGRPILNWYDVSIQFQEVDPELFTILTGLLPYEDYEGNVIGFPVTETDYATANFSLELWMQNAEQECPPDGAPLPFYGVNLMPWVTEGSIAENITVANSLITFTLAGRTRKGTPWGTGPYNVMLDENGDPAPLPTAIPTDTHHFPFWTQLPPPEAVCGCQSLSS